MNTTLPPLSSFKAWLQPQPWQRIIGDRLSTADCPLVGWLKTCLPGPVLVDEETIMLGSLSDTDETMAWEVHATPLDYRDFITRIDYGGNGVRGVCVEECLTVLREMTAEEGV